MDAGSGDTGTGAAVRQGGAARVAAVLAAAVAFGAADQYLPVAVSFAHPGASLLAYAVSQMSAPWLLVGFLAGAWQGGPRRAAVAGLAATWLALFAFVLMIVSPVEGTHLGPPPPGWHGSWLQLTPGLLWMILLSQGLWFAGGLITGPLYGWLGYRWRASRSPWPAFLAALPVLLEPAARWVAAHVGLSFGIWPGISGAAEFAEFAVGMLLTVAAVRALRRGHTAARSG